MINDVNHLIIIGTLGEDAKVSKTKKQEPMVILNVATKNEWFEGSEIKKKTLWNKVFFFGDQALACENYKKGMKVHITGEVSEKSIPDGETKTYKTIINGLSVWVIDLGSRNRPSQDVASQVIGPLLVPAIQPPGLQGHLREYFFEVNSL